MTSVLWGEANLFGLAPERARSSSGPQGRKRPQG